MSVSCVIIAISSPKLIVFFTIYIYTLSFYQSQNPFLDLTLTRRLRYTPVLYVLIRNLFVTIKGPMQSGRQPPQEKKKQSSKHEVYNDSESLGSF